MPPVGVKGALPAPQPPEHGEGRVRERDGQCQQRHEKADERVKFQQTQHAHGAQRETEKLRTGVAHEDARRAAVIGQKAQTGAVERGQQHRHRGRRDGQSHQQHAQRADGGHADGQPVQPVDQVDGVGAGDDPQHRQRGGQGIGEGDAPAGEGGHRAEDDPAAHGDGRRGQLRQQLDGGPEIEEIVQRAHQYDQQRAAEQAGHRPFGRAKRGSHHQKAQ